MCRNWRIHGHWSNQLNTTNSRCNGILIYPCDHHHSRHFHDHLHHHGDHGRLSSHGPDHLGSENDRGHAYHSLSHDDRLCEENSLDVEGELWNDLGEESDHDGLEVVHDHVQNQNAMKRKEEYEPTVIISERDPERESNLYPHLNF